MVDEYANLQRHCMAFGVDALRTLADLRDVLTAIETVAGLVRDKLQDTEEGLLSQVREASRRSPPDTAP